MLEYRLTPHHAGIALWGDGAALSRLHEFVHHVVAESPYIEDKEGFVLGLAYDVRKAFQGQRSQDHRAFSENDRCHIYGVEILWPMLLVQVGMLRQAMAFIPTNKLDQAIMFELEHVVESAVRTAMPVTADEVIHRIRCIGSASYIHTRQCARQPVPVFHRASRQTTTEGVAEADGNLRSDVWLPGRLGSQALVRRHLAQRFRKKRRKVARLRMVSQSA
jgi:hypothetical protein